MSNIRYFALSGAAEPPRFVLSQGDKLSHATCSDGTIIPGCMFGEALWVKAPFSAPGLKKHKSDMVMLLIGGDIENPDKLGATVHMTIENDVLTLTDTCAVFVPGDAAYGNIEVTDFERPFFCYFCHLNTDTYECSPAEATAPGGTYSGNYVEKYAPPDGKLPGAPEGFLKLLLYLDGVRLKGAPYIEAVWFCQTNDTGPAPHIHEDFDEFIGFFGTDPENPGDLGATVDFFIGDEKITVTKSCLVYIPRGVEHSPIYVPEMKRPIIHFSGGNGGDYVRKSGNDDIGRENNSFKK